jgi:fructose-1,6-bisphosphatase
LPSTYDRYDLAILSVVSNGSVMCLTRQGQGIVTNVVSAKAKAKLRLLYEAAPIALIGACCSMG